MRAAAASAPAAGDRERWILYVSDGGATTGLRRVADLEDAVAELVAADGALRVGTVAIGHDADAAVLGALARGGGGSALAWTPGQASATSPAPPSTAPPGSACAAPPSSCRRASSIWRRASCRPWSPATRSCSRPGSRPRPGWCAAT
ncbi:MAG: hypothetical protein R2939_11085 [Kofleriaceae bacterium]